LVRNEQMNIKDEHGQITIGTRKYLLQDRLTLIIGKIKDDDIISIKDENLVELITNLDPIPVENLIKNLDSFYPMIKESINLLKYLKNYLKSIDLNTDLLSNLINLTHKIIKLFQIITLNNEKSRLNKELEIAKTFKQSSEIKAISDLLEKLNKSLIENKTKLSYLAQDYQKKKNQIDNVNKDIQKNNDILQNLTNKKKMCFSYINKITRNMDISSKLITNEEELNSLLDLDSEMTNAEKIRLLQIKAREIQYEINKLKLNLDEISQIHDDLFPQFKIITQDYDKLVHLIKEDENKAKIKENELKKALTSLDVSLSEQVQKIDFKSIKTPSQIELALSDLELRMETILTSETYVNDDSIINFEALTDELGKLINFLNKNKNKMTISDADQKFDKMFEGYFILESHVTKLEETLNLLLNEINLRINLEISITEDYKKLLIHPQFTRTKNDNLPFNDLTTPEKIYFIIILQIAIKMLQRSKTIIISNAFIPDTYNKRGSIFRTIRKLIQLFERNSTFNDYTIVFIISNLELKNQINNIKIIKIIDSD